MKALRIIKCPDTSRWYADKIGDIVPLFAIERTEYKSCEPAGYINFVQLEDAEIIDVDDP
jgi:hypothetical protein